MRKVKANNGGTLHIPEKGETANPKGRPKKSFSRFADEMRAKGYEGATDVQVREALQVLAALPMAEVMRIAGDPAKEKAAGDETNETPILIRRLAAELLGKRGQEMLKDLLSRIASLPAQKNEVEHTFTQTAKYTLPDGTIIEF